MDTSDLQPNSLSDSDDTLVIPSEISCWQPLLENLGTLQSMTVPKLDDSSNFNWEKLRDEELEVLLKFMEESNQAITAENDLLENYLTTMDPLLIENMESILEATTAAIHKAERTQQLGMMASVTSRSQTSRGGQESYSTTPRSSQTQTGDSKLAAFALNDKGPKIQPTQKMEIIQREMDCLKASYEEEKGKVDKSSFLARCHMSAMSMRLRDISAAKSHFEDCVTKEWPDEVTKNIAGEKVIQFFESRRKSDAMQKKALETKRKNLKIQLEAVNLKLRELGDELKYVDYGKLQILNQQTREDLASTTRQLNSLSMSNSSNLEQLSRAREAKFRQLRRAENLEKAADQFEDKIGFLLREEAETKEEILQRENKIGKLVNLRKKYEPPSVMEYVSAKNQLQEVDGALKYKNKRGRGQHGGDKHGHGNKGSGQRQNYMRLGYETGNTPFYLRFSYEGYYKGHHLKREYPPLSLLQLQTLIDTNRLDASQFIDLTSLSLTDIYRFNPEHRHFGVQLTDEGLNRFQSKVDIEVQYATEPVIAAIERLGGSVTLAYYDMHSLMAMRNPEDFFRKGMPIPKRMLPPEDAMEVYTSAAKRGYLADPQEIEHERGVLAQKYGYPLVKRDPPPRKDPRQVFWGLQPGWVVNLKDSSILKPKDEEIVEYYES